MKKILACFSMCCLVVVLLNGCIIPYGAKTEHTFLQSREDVVKVEISTCSNVTVWGNGEKVETILPLVELSNEEIDLLWNELLAFPANTVKVLDYGCGDLMFVFTYANGQQELIGFYKIAVLNADGTFLQYRNHALTDPKLMTALFAKFADLALLSEVSDDFRSYYNYK